MVWTTSFTWSRNVLFWERRKSLNFKTDGFQQHITLFLRSLWFYRRIGEVKVGQDRLTSFSIVRRYTSKGFGWRKVRSEQYYSQFHSSSFHGTHFTILRDSMSRSKDLYQNVPFLSVSLTVQNYDPSKDPGNTSPVPLLQDPSRVRDWPFETPIFFTLTTFTMGDLNLYCLLPSYHGTRVCIPRTLVRYEVFTLYRFKVIPSTLMWY